MFSHSRYTLAFFVALLMMLSGALFGVYQLNASLDRYRTVVKSSDDNQIAFGELAVVFKVQVQEWKNTLLRGRNPQDLALHWDAFVAREAEVATKTRQLQAQLPEGDSKLLLARFAQEHEALGKRYREGLERFKRSGFDPAAGDAAVRGIDREPEQLLTGAGEKIGSYRIWVSTNVAAQAQRAAFLGLGAILMAGVFCVFVFLML